MRGDRHVNKGLESVEHIRRQVVVRGPDVLSAAKMGGDKRRIGRQMRDQFQQITRRQIRVVRQDVAQMNAIEPSKIGG